MSLFSCPEDLAPLPKPARAAWLGGLLALLLATLVALTATGTVRAAVSVVDDHAQTLTLPQPARRIVSISPHVTEMLFAAGAGERVVGVTAYSDFPEAARRLPQVGGAHALDLERIAALRPDLIVVWLHGTSARQLDALKRLGLPIYYDEPRQLEDIARSVERLSVLSGTEATAKAFGEDYRRRLAALRRQYADRAPVSVFHQVWSKPLMTVNGQHLISDVMRLCGGRNLFGDEELLVPQPTLEAVISRDPEVITSAGMGDKPADFSMWRPWPRLKAVQRQQLVTLPGDLISRHSPRILDGAKLMCEALELARAKR